MSAIQRRKKRAQRGGAEFFAPGWLNGFDNLLRLPGIISKDMLCPLKAGCITTACQMVNSAFITDMLIQIWVILSDDKAGHFCQAARPGRVADLIPHNMQRFILA